MSNDDSKFLDNADFWNWLANRDAEPDVAYNPIELTLDIEPLSHRKSAPENTGSVRDLTNSFEISHDVSFEISGNVVYELRRG
jgi:hypothetical protein